MGKGEIWLFSYKIFLIRILTDPRSKVEIFFHYFSLKGKLFCVAIYLNIKVFKNSLDEDSRILCCKSILI